MGALSVPVHGGLRRVDLRVVGAIAAAPLLLLVARLLPAEGLGLGLRLLAAALCVLVLPGALVLRAFAWPSEPGLAVSASFALSLAVVFFAFAVVFWLGTPLVVVVALVAAVGAAAVLPALRARPEPPARPDVVALAALCVAGLGFAALVWWARESVGTGDVLMHMARTRKLAETEVLSSVNVANEYRDGGLHPGYAFPLWHGVIALIAKLAGVDVATATLRLSPVLAPLALTVAYAAGRTLFGSWAGGVATSLAQAALLGFSRDGVGVFASLSGPGPATRALVAPALLALAFACVRGGSRRLLVPLAAASLALAVIHPTYVIFVAIPLVAFLTLWALVDAERRHAARVAAAIAAAVVIPACAFFLWLLPVIQSTASHSPTEREEARAIAHYGDQLQVVGDAYRAAPNVITRAGPVIVAAFAVLPLLVLVRRRPWALFPLVGMLTVLAILLVPELFTRFSDLVSISQSRRLAQFLPVAFAVAGAAVLAGRLRAVGIALAFGFGLALELLYAAETTHVVGAGGPVWPLWITVVGTGAVLTVVLILRRRSLEPDVNRWSAFAALAFVLPIAVGGVADIDRAEAADRYAPTPGLIEAVGRLPDESVVLAPVETSYRIPAFANVYVVATPPPHAADTGQNRPYARQRAVIRFYASRSPFSDADRRELFEEYGVDWVVLDKTRAFPRTLVEPFERIYEDGRYALLRVPRR